MAIAEQFAGLQMDQLIGGPLSAAADASNQLANSTADFINRVGFDANGKVRTVAFGYQKRSVNEDGTSNLDEMKVDVPMLAIVPIPNLQVDEVNILFDMEVKQSERQESSKDMNASLNASVNLGIVKVNVTGSVSSHQSNTRSSDNSAKYHVDVRATNHGTPEGLARVLDMMAANVAPALVGTTLKDGNGQDLSEQARVKAERLKTLRHEMRQIEERLDAAQSSLSTSLAQLKKIATTQLNAYQGRIMVFQNKLDKDSEADNVKADNYNESMSMVNQSWTDFQSRVGDLIKLIADSGETGNGVSDMFALKQLEVDEANGSKVVMYTTTQEDGSTNHYATIVAAQEKAVEAQKKVDAIDAELATKKAEYSDAIAGKIAPAKIENNGNEDGK